MQSSAKKLNESQLLQYDDEVIQQQIENGIVELIEENAYNLRKDCNKSFLAHKAVFRENAESTKCRIVYLSNLAEKGNGNNLSHNQVSFPGPNLNPKLVIALTMLRFNRYLFIFDLEKAFHQLCLNESDSDKLCFLWFKNLKENDRTVVAYRLVRVPFGMRFSPFLLMMSLFVILILHANILSERELNLRSMLHCLSYMDNLAYSADNYDDLRYALDKSFEIFNSVGFNLQQFCSNNQELSKNFPLAKDLSNECKLLGIKWNFVSDSLSNRGCELNADASTKREILSSLNGVFDPLGILTPILNRAKLFLHALQVKSVKWDAVLSENELKEWRLICRQFNNGKEFIIPRYLGELDSNYELIAFCDASNELYGCVIYLSEVNSGNMKFLLAKNRVVAKNRQTKSIPVLELFSMEFAVETAVGLYVELSNMFKPVNISGLHIYSDSMISLNWLVSKVSKFDKIERKGSCINNKLNSIVKLCNKIPASFYHVCGLDNPADKVTRCVSSAVLSRSNYLEGPTLLDKADAMVTVPYNAESSHYCCNAVHTELISEPLIPFDRFSSFDKLCRVYHYASKFVAKLKARIKEKKENAVPASEPGFTDSRLAILRVAQANSFPSELKALKGKFLGYKAGDGLITQLNLFLDEDGLIRVRGKLRSTDGLPNLKFPILLHKKCTLTRVIIENLHRKIKHVGIYKLLHLLQKEFWVPCALQTIKKIVNKCLVCKKLNGRTIKLSQNCYREYRLNPKQVPFREIAMDHIGPFNVRNSGKVTKMYVLIITCFFTRAVNLLLCGKIDRKSFLLSFQEHIFSYGVPSRIVSDNGSPIVSSLRIITDLLADVEVRNFLTERGIEHLKFEPYPANASFLGGIVESLVKQVKHMIHSALGKNILEVEEFNLLIRECEMLINKRPLAGETTVLNKNIDETVQVLTPEMLVKGYDVPSLRVLPGL